MGEYLVFVAFGCARMSVYLPGAQAQAKLRLLSLTQVANDTFEESVQRVPGTWWALQLRTEN